VPARASRRWIQSRALATWAASSLEIQFFFFSSLVVAAPVDGVVEGGEGDAGAVGDGGVEEVGHGLAQDLEAVAPGHGVGDVAEDDGPRGRVAHPAEGRPAGRRRLEDADQVRTSRPVGGGGGALVFDDHLDGIDASDFATRRQSRPDVDDGAPRQDEVPDAALVRRDLDDDFLCFVALFVFVVQVRVWDEGRGDVRPGADEVVGVAEGY